MPAKFYNIIRNKSNFMLLSYTWGIVMTILGFIVSIPFSIYCRYVKDISEQKGYCTYFRFGKSWGGFSLGPYCFVSKTAKIKTLEHEQGHSLQNCLYGPLMLIFSLCSVIRYHYRNIRENINIPCKSEYDDFWFEGQATSWGNELFNNANKK